MPAHGVVSDQQRMIHPNVVASHPDWWYPSTTGGVAAANNHGTTVCRVPVTGTLRDVMIWVQTSSGNVSASVYSVGVGTAARTRLWTSGSVVCGATGNWQIVGDPALAVTEGQLISLGMGCDNTTALFGRYSIASGGAANVPAAYSPEGAVQTFSLNTGFPDPGTTLTPVLTGIAMLVVARVVPS